MILVTGSAGFIGAHVAGALLRRGETVLGVDNHNGYYDVALKRRRLEALTAHPGYLHCRADIGDRGRLDALFRRFRPRRIVHLAAQAGVRHSISHPHDYVESNLVGFVNVLEAARRYGIGHLVYASSSSVYGDGGAGPLGEEMPCDKPLSLYAATKRANELMAHSYAHLYALPATGLRFFTVYGPWGRPDMAPMIFAGAILEGRPITLFNHGHHARSFTYVDDIVGGILDVLDRPPVAGPAGAPPPPGASAPHAIYNIGSPVSTPLLEFVGCLERALGRSPQLEFAPPAPGDVRETLADTARFAAAFGDRRYTPLAEGVARFADWYRRDRETGPAAGSGARSAERPVPTAAEPGAP